MQLSTSQLVQIGQNHQNVYNLVEILQKSIVQALCKIHFSPPSCPGATRPSEVPQHNRGDSRVHVAHRTGNVGFLNPQTRGWYLDISWYLEKTYNCNSYFSYNSCDSYFSFNMRLILFFHGCKVHGSHGGLCLHSPKMELSWKLLIADSL